MALRLMKIQVSFVPKVSVLCVALISISIVAWAQEVIDPSEGYCLVSEADGIDCALSHFSIAGAIQGRKSIQLDREIAGRSVKFIPAYSCFVRGKRYALFIPKKGGGPFFLYDVLENEERHYSYSDGFRPFRVLFDGEFLGVLGGDERYGYELRELDSPCRILSFKGIDINSDFFPDPSGGFSFIGSISSDGSYGVGIDFPPREVKSLMKIDLHDMSVSLVREIVAPPSYIVDSSVAYNGSFVVLAKNNQDKEWSLISTDIDGANTVIKRLENSSSTTYRLTNVDIGGRYFLLHMSNGSVVKYTEYDLLLNRVNESSIQSDSPTGARFSLDSFLSSGGLYLAGSWSDEDLFACETAVKVLLFYGEVNENQMESIELGEWSPTRDLLYADKSKRAVVGLPNAPLSVSSVLVQTNGQLNLVGRGGTK